MTKRKPRKGRPPQPKDKPMEVAIAARMRRFGLPVALAVDQKAETALGRLRLANSITEPQYEAGDLFFKAWGKVCRAVMGPKGLETAQPGSMGDTVTEEYITWATRAVRDFNIEKNRLDATQWAAVNLTALEGHEPTDLEALRDGLTVLAQTYGLIKGVAA